MLRAFILVLLVLPLAAQRLPDNVTPDHYILKFSPDLKAATFGGEETIHAKAKAPTKQITLNAIEIEFRRVTLQALPNGAIQEAQVSLDPKSQQATLTVDQQLPAGDLEIKIEYTGKLNDQLRGFYLNRANNRTYASTQFEPTDARRAFPGWDEPAYKATFDISIVIDEADTAISNGAVIKDEPSPAGKRTITFATSPKMSTYLVALAVGDFKCLEGSSDGIPIRVCATPDKVKFTKYALEATEDVVHFLNTYYETKYPFKKLDIVAVPDFEAGAMENVGAIFYRETFLLVPDDATDASKRNVTSTVVHEVAHQWFGDLVTMSWWNDLWLSEGFATWMQAEALGKLKPEWKPDVGEAANAQYAMTADSLLSTRPIRQRVSTPAEINELFDAIAYQKTAAVLRMVEKYIGDDVFRAGINLYLKEHAYGNATAEDFWGAMARASGKPIDKIIASFVTHPGLPLISASRSCRNGKSTVTLAQKRYVQERKAFDAGSSEVWSVPVCMRDGDMNSTTRCELLSQKSQTFSFNGCPDFLSLNADATGYYRTAYDPAEIRKALPSILDKMTASERVALVNDEWALMRTGVHEIGDYMAIAAALGKDQESTVVGALAGKINYIAKRLVANDDRARFEGWVRSTFTPSARDLGWISSPSDSDDRRELRKAVIYTLGYIGRDQQTLREAREEVQKIINKTSKLDPNMVEIAITLAATEGDAELFEQYLAQMKKASSPDEFYRYQGALSEFRDPALLDRALKLLLAPEMRNQDAPFYLAGFFATPTAQHQAWGFFKTNWAGLQRHLTTWGGADAVKGTAAFCDVKTRNEVEQFFATHKVPASERALKGALEQIDACLDLRARQTAKLSAWLQHSQGSTTYAGRR